MNGSISRGQYPDKIAGFEIQGWAPGFGENQTCGIKINVLFLKLNMCRNYNLNNDQELAVKITIGRQNPVINKQLHD